MKYLPPFDLIRRSLEISTVKGELRVSVSYEEFLNIIRSMIAGIEVDEAWYARAYEDIGAAVRDGKIASARQHFVADGYIEGRKPPSVPMMMRHLPPGSLDPQARKDHLVHAHAFHTDRCRGGWRLERRP